MNVVTISNIRVHVAPSHENASFSSSDIIEAHKAESEISFYATPSLQHGSLLGAISDPEMVDVSTTSPSERERVVTVSKF